MCACCCFNVLCVSCTVGQVQTITLHVMHTTALEASAHYTCLRDEKGQGGLPDVKMSFAHLLIGAGRNATLVCVGKNGMRGKNGTRDVLAAYNDKKSSGH